MCIRRACTGLFSASLPEPLQKEKIMNLLSDSLRLRTCRFFRLADAWPATTIHTFTEFNKTQADSWFDSSIVFKDSNSINGMFAL